MRTDPKQSLRFEGFCCLKCASHFPSENDGIYSIVKDKISFHMPGGMVGREMVCKQCKEKHEWLFAAGELTLSLTAVSKDYAGTKEKVFRVKS